MRQFPALSRATLALCLIVGCNSNQAATWQSDLAEPPLIGDGGVSAPDLSPSPSSASPITAPARIWTWVDFPDSRCDDGTATGIGVNLNPDSQDLLVFLNGGGACWDELTCLFADTAVHGPFGERELADVTGNLGGSIFDRDEPRNPFKDYSMVFVPYCTGDFHGGDNVAQYGGADYHHKGHHNVMLFLARLGPTFPSPRKLALTGSSAGGYGASLNYVGFKARWPNAKTYLIDDSGPVLRGDAIPADFRDGWFSAWKIDRLLEPLCGQVCLDDLSVAVQVIAMRNPGDRMALLSSMRDAAISGSLLMSGDRFEMELKKLAAEILEPAANIRYFFVPGDSHVMLGAPGGFAQSNVTLWDWLSAMVNDDADWASVKPY